MKKGHERYNDQPRLEKALKVYFEYSLKGIESANTGKEITKHFNEVGFRDLTQRQLRWTIRDLRRDGFPICFRGGVGYFFPDSLEDVHKCKAEFDSKATDMLETGRAMLAGAEKLFGKQRGLGI